jgi:hypothetical protein
VLLELAPAPTVPTKWTRASPVHVMKPVHALLGNVLVPTAQTRNPLARKSLSVVMLWGS